MSQEQCHCRDEKVISLNLCAFIFFFLWTPVFPSQFSGIYERNKIMSAESERNLIVLLQRQGKDCISMKWAIDLSDENPAWDGCLMLHSFFGNQQWNRGKWFILIT